MGAKKNTGNVFMETLANDMQNPLFRLNINVMKFVFKFGVGAMVVLGLLIRAFT